MKTIEQTATFSIENEGLKPFGNDNQGSTVVKLPVAEKSELPLAFSHMDGDDDTLHLKEYLVSGNKLYTRARNADDSDWKPFTEIEHAFHETFVFSAPAGEAYALPPEVADCISQIHRRFSPYLLIENGDIAGGYEVWEQVGEPRYVVSTLGIGNNQGGTSLFIVNDYNEKVASENYFNALQFEEAVRFGVATATARGDDRSIHNIMEAEKITVYMKDIVRLDPVADIRKLEQNKSASSSVGASASNI